MTLEEFIEEEKERLERFRLWWKEEEKEDPEAFPPEMEPGDWDDSFEVFE